MNTLPRIPRLPAAGLTALLAVLAPSCSPAESEPVGQGLVVLDPEERPTDRRHVDEHGHDHGDDHGHDHGPAETDVRAYFHDFGTVPDGETVTTTFRLKNTDPVPLTITRMSPSCGCTVPAVRYTAESGEVVVGSPSNEPEILVIPPGVVAEIDVSIDSTRVRGKNVHKLMQVRITTDSPNDPFLTLETSLLVEQPFRILGEQLTFGRMPRSIGGRSTTEITQTAKNGSVLTGVAATPEGVVATLSQLDVVGRTAWTLEAEILPPLDLGSYNEEIEVAVANAAGEPLPPLIVGMRGLVVDDIRIVPGRVFLRDYKSDGIASTSVQVSTMIPGARFAITGVEKTGSVADFIDVTYTALDEPGVESSSAWTVEITARPGIDADTFSGSITLLTDDAQNPRIKITYAGL